MVELDNQQKSNVNMDRHLTLVAKREARLKREEMIMEDMRILKALAKALALVLVGVGLGYTWRMMQGG